MTIKEKILKIMSLALEIDPPEEEDIGKKKTAVFVRWVPHVAEIAVDIHYSGWRADEFPDKELRVYTHRRDAGRLLDEMIEVLEGLV